MRIFDTRVQELKYKVLREVARQEWNGTLTQNLLDIPKTIVPGKIPTMRCCVYKERAILAERVKLAMGGDPADKRVIQVLDIACDECPAAGYDVTDSCRGCLAHRCMDACKKGAITISADHTAHIDKTKCVECGMCASVCPYTAIINRKRPCQNACKVKAIKINDDNSAVIDDEKCISCGACVYQCPFGAISDKSYILDVVRMLKAAEDGGPKVYAVVAPSISAQFTHAKLGQVITGLKMLGFDTVMEAALGADMVAQDESRELAERGFLTSSCCPAFVSFIRKTYPKLTGYISDSLSPMATIAKFIKETFGEEIKVVFIGPCTAKKKEIQLDTVAPYVDSVLTFEELQALFDSRDIEITALEESGLDNASYFGRIFARCGGLSDAVAEGLKEQGLTFDLKPVSCDGIEECKTALLKKSRNVLDANFVEGMACTGGCIGGAGCLTHSPRSRAQVDQYSALGTRSIAEAVDAAKE